MKRSFLFRRLLLGATIFSFFTSLLGLPFAAFAGLDAPSIKDKISGGGTPVLIGGNIAEQINAAYENIRWEIIGTGTMAFMNAMQTFFGQLAFDAADYIATGGKGQSSLYYKKGFLGYLQDVGGSAAGEFIGSMSQASFFQTIGFDLCRPPDPKTLLRIQLSLGQFLPNGQTGAFTRPQARCDFNDIVRNYDQVYQTLSNRDVLDNIDASLNTNSNDLGVSFLIFNRAHEYVYRQQQTAEKDRKEGEGYQGLRDIISGRIRTPSDTIREEANQVLVKDPKANQATINTFILQQAWEMGPSRLAMYTASVFLNTLSSRMITKIFEEGIGILDVFNTKLHTGSRDPDSLLQGNKEDSRKANIDLRTPNLFKSEAYDVLVEMQACPSDRGTWNCSIDEGLAQALRSEGDSGLFTIREAIDRGLLKKDWRLFPSSNQREERDPLCYTYGYCSGNLRKLRLMRILPVGFEFAADDKANVSRCAGSEGCVTLGEVVDGFADCDAQGQRDGEHPWCKLIDPNWALTMLPQQCALTGFGDSMLSPKLPQRREECQDIETCLQRNDRGECVGGFGHCVAEKAVYRFGGQECSAKFASCRTYQPRGVDGEGSSATQVSYLRNTLDYARCSEDNVGCLWYATARDAGSNDADAWVGTPTSGPRVYFDKTMETCDAAKDGCTRLLAVRPGESALNLVQNSSFEKMSSGDALLDTWLPLTGTGRGYVQPTVAEGEAAADGANAAHFAGSYVSGYRQVIEAMPGRNYVLSGFTRRLVASGAAPIRIGVRQYPSRAAALEQAGRLGATPLARDFRTRECVFETTGAGAGTVSLAPVSADGVVAWGRSECGFTSNSSTQAFEIVIEGANALADAVMLEEGTSATTYVNSLNQSLAVVHHKVAPNELGCQGTDADHPLCAGFAKVCRQTEAGCQGYTDLNSSFPEVAAQVNPNDACPNACVGYAEYRKLASAFDLVKSAEPAMNDAADTQSEYFVPATAQQCSQAEVGCEAFTIVDAAQDGGESRAAFNRLRSCEQPNELDSATYFTWEGSDAAGYQLRTWSLKKRTAAKPGATPPFPEGAAIADASGPRIVANRSGDLFSPKDPANCDEATWRTTLDQDCRQFYDGAGNVFYRYYSQTVLSTADCRTYRLADTNEDDCTKTGGSYRTDERSCLYQAYAPESGSCSLAAAGCRAYAGAEAGNVLSVFSANGASSTMVTGATVSAESLQVGDRSYRANAPADGRSSVSVAFPSRAGGLYRVAFWMKASASSTVVVSSLRPGAPTSDARTVGTVRLTPQWQRLSLGLFEGATGDRTSLLWTVSAGSAPVAYFVDEINVQELRDMAYVRRGTWSTPAECDQNAFGLPEPQAMLNCREYRTRTAQTVAVRQFSQLCRPAAIGCAEFVDTRNSENPYAQDFDLGDGAATSTTRRPADRYIYLIDDVAKRCDAANASCRAFGKPVLSADRESIARFETVYLKDDVRRYGEGLCRPSELFCEEFTTAAGREYFKDPQTHLCEYRAQVEVSEGESAVPEGTYSGWFIKGTSLPCYENALASGQVFQILRTGDANPAPGYQGWAGTCPVEESECTELRDPNDKSDGSLIGRPYYFINNEQIDTRSCAGTVDPSRGCVLLRNMSDSRSLYSTEATLEAYQSGGLRPVPAVDCQANPAQAGCSVARTGRCIGTRVVERRASDLVSGTISVQQAVRSPYVGGSCAEESDCAPEQTTRYSGQLLRVTSLRGTTEASEYTTTIEGLECDRLSLNDANMVVKVKMDRDCAQWLGCATGETLYDPSTNRYREMCTKVALCDRPGDLTSSSAGYCGNYVNRASTSTEPVLTAGAYFDARQYASRPVALGARDYSGRSIPNAFQLVDLQSRPVVQDAAIRSIDVSSERRLVVAVKMPPIDTDSLDAGPTAPIVHTIPPTRPNQAEAISRANGVYSTAAPGTLLCRHRGNGMVGYFVKQEVLPGREVNCYFSLRGGSVLDEYPALQARVRGNAGKQDLVLDHAYPKSLCRAYPESEAPFSSGVVSRWDMTKNPIRPLTRRSGYEYANVCAYGEDCSCSYKRVEYEGLLNPLFYGPNSQAVPPGICVGGPRDGQACLPSEVFDISSSTSTSAKVAEAANNNQTCGSAAGGGRCVAFKKAEIVRGVMGSCLEYDTTRSRGKIGEETFSCLNWNPSPIIGGENDPYRYVQTAGYFPPQNAGQYYCTSRAKTPQSYSLAADDILIRPEGVVHIDYDDRYVSDGSAGAGGNLAGAYLGGGRPIGSRAAGQCEDADDDQDDDGDFQRDFAALRLVSTGRSESTSYTETFYGLRPSWYAGWLNRISPAATTGDMRRQSLLEQNFSFIEIRPFENPNGNGRLACGYQEDWVDGVHVDDYDSLEKTGPADKQWRSAFFSEEDLQTYLTRGSEQVLTRDGRPDGRPIQMPCTRLSEGGAAGEGGELPPDSRCYFKTWEIGYRSSGQKKFVAFQPSVTDTVRNRGSEGFAGLQAPLYEQCDSEKPYYAIRAVFQTDASVQSVAPETIDARSIRGPWRLTGFWVSSCAGKASTDARFIYMNVRIQNADICRELAEVRSFKSNQDAAFTDRVWRESKYSVPVLNIQYGQSFAPFSSALNTGPAGEDPLYQTGGKLAGSSAIRPPTFLASGYDTYAGPAAANPKDRYAYLSNLFARIYRVYRYNDQRIDENDHVCAAGPNQGRTCVPDSPARATAIPDVGPSVDCRALTGSAACDTGTPPPATLRVCNALSGINAGRACGGSPESCHQYAVDPTPTVRTPRPLLTSCQVQGAWEKHPDNDSYRNGSTGSYIAQRLAAGQGAFRCAPGAVKLRDAFASDLDPVGAETVTEGGTSVTVYQGMPATTLPGLTVGSGATARYYASGLIPREETVRCSQPTTDVSEECPLEVTGICDKPAGASARTPGQCIVSWEGRTDVRTNISCQLDTDCGFNILNFWRNSRTAVIPAGSYSVDTLDGRYGAVRVRRGIKADGPVSFGGRLAVSSPLSDYDLSGTNTVYTRTTPSADGGTELMIETERFPGAVPSLHSAALPSGHTADYRVEVNQYVVGACQPLADLVRRSGDQISLGTCSEGAAHAGDLCLVAGETASFPYRQWASGERACASTAVTTVPGSDACEPVSQTLNGARVPANSPARSGAMGYAGTVAFTYASPGIDCRIPGQPLEETRMDAVQFWTAKNIPPEKRNMNNDNNACTSEVGYQPQLRLCPNPSSEFCGLIAYDMRQPGLVTTGGGGGDVNSLNPAQPTVPLPTDVTLGHYTPSYLGFTGLAESAYAYLDYYTPKPPRIAAPPSQCPAGSSCGVDGLDRFSFGGATQGVLNVVGGQYRATIRFFGWAAHEQMAIRRLAVDWGDGVVQDFDDVKLKNRKPFCSVQKECYAPAEGFTGLTCQTDTDCPLSAQACRALGSCKEKKNVVCAQTADCRRDGSLDTCEPRAFFGNSADACDASPFEFAHVYTCPANAASSLPRCSGQNLLVGSGAVGSALPADVIAPAGATPGTCFFGPADPTVVGMFPRPSCTATGAAGETQCRAAYRSLFGIVDADVTRPSASFPASIFNGVSCGPPSTAATTPALVGADGRAVVTQARCAQDPSRFCTTNTDCAAGDRCIATGLAPAGGCWDDQANACRHTPRVFIQDNWGWCTGECRTTTNGAGLADAPTSPVKHPYGGCYTPVSVGADPGTEATRLNTQASTASTSEPSRLTGSSGTGYRGIECAIGRPDGPLGASTDVRRSYRPWIVFPGSLQLRPKN